MHAQPLLGSGPLPLKSVPILLTFHMGGMLIGLSERQHMPPLHVASFHLMVDAVASTHGLG